MTLMSKDSFDKIKQFGSNQDPPASTQEVDFMIRKFIVSFYDNFDESASTQEDIKSRENALLTGETLKSSLISAREFFNKYEENLIKDINKKQSKSIFKDIGISLLSSFIYSFVVAIIIWLGQEPLGKFISELISQNQK